MITTIVIFIIILGILVFVHEFGHFIVAKKSGMQVDEFGFGFPPRIAGIQKVEGKWKWIWGNKKQVHPSQKYAFSSAGDRGGEHLEDQNLLSEETVYSINFIPLGGFVKIRGENNEAENDPRSFINKGFWPRFFTLVAGVTMNWLLAAVIFSIALMIGTLSAISPDMPAYIKVSDRQVAINSVLPGSPAEKAGLKTEDFIVSIDGNKFENVDRAREYIYANKGKAFEFQVQRINEVITVNVQSLANPGPDKGPTGIDLSDIAKIQLPWTQAIVVGFKQTYYATTIIVQQLGGLFSGHQSLDQVGGPVKIAKVVGQARQVGFVPLLNLTALLSLSLAVLNIMPFPALDGGRVLFLFIEKIRGKKNNQKVEQAFNATGFVLLLLLMLVVTVNDIIRK